jgi:hypothetical protein
MTANIKWVVYDLFDESYKYLHEYGNGCTVERYDSLDNINFYSIIKFDTEEEAWKNAGIYCTVIPIRVN